MERCEELEEEKKYSNLSDWQRWGNNGDEKGQQREDESSNPKWVQGFGEEW